MNKLRLIPLGGMGSVTQNMFVYEYDDEMLIVDCGIGFPDLHMPGVDVLIPDISYLQKALEQGKHIVGMVLSHGHDDHIGALPYILPDLPMFPIYGSPLTVGFAQDRIAESTAADRQMTMMEPRREYHISTHFKVRAYAVTHSVPDTRHLVISTPVGTIYHGSDFKLDQHPIDGIKTDMEGIGALSQENILCMLVDCLRVEKPQWVGSESLAGPALLRTMEQTRGKFILTLMSSHIHRIQQAVDAAESLGRKVTFIGRSVEQNVRVAVDLKKLRLPSEMWIDKRDLDQWADDKLCVIVAGSQGQEGSSMVRAIYGDHPMLQILPEDKVVFSADAIPGNEVPYYAAIDELCRNGVNVEYPAINPDLHQSGHASAAEQAELVRAVRPHLLMPIGGADRHRVKFVEYVAQPNGYRVDQVLLPGYGEVIEFSNGQASMGETLDLQTIHVDGLGIGDVGNIVLADRRTLGDEGIIVLVLPRRSGKIDFKNMEVVSRGFVFMKEAEEVIDFIKQQTKEIANELGAKTKDAELKRAIERRLGRRLDKIIRRQPLIVPLFIDIA